MFHVHSLTKTYTSVFHGGWMWLVHALLVNHAVCIVVKMNDKDLIASLGGPTALAKRLGFKTPRVGNWVARGIPAKVKLDNPDVFGIKQKRRGVRK